MEAESTRPQSSWPHNCECVDCCVSCAVVSKALILSINTQAQAGSRAIFPDYVIVSEQCSDESISDILD